MFKLHSSPGELKLALEHLSNHRRAHDFLGFTESIKVELNNLFPYNKLALYSYNINQTTYWFAQKNYDIVRPISYIVADGEINHKELNEAFAAFDNVEHLTDGQPRTMRVESLDLLEKIKSILLEHGAPTTLKTRSIIRFYMTKQQEQFALDYELKVPDGYELGSATPEDGDFITSNWQYADKGDDEQTRRKIQSLPSSCVRCDGQIVAFYVVDPAAMLCNQFVVPEHRNKGLGKLVEMDLSQKLIRQGFTVYKHVDLWNTQVIENSKKYFTQSTLSNGEPNLFTWIHY